MIPALLLLATLGVVDPTSPQHLVGSAGMAAVIAEATESPKVSFGLTVGLGLYKEFKLDSYPDPHDILFDALGASIGVSIYRNNQTIFPRVMFTGDSVSLLWRF